MSISVTVTPLDETHCLRHAEYAHHQQADRDGTDTRTLVDESTHHDGSTNEKCECSPESIQILQCTIPVAAPLNGAEPNANTPPSAATSQ